MANAEQTKRFPRDQYLVLNYLRDKEDVASVDELVEALNLDQIFVSSAVQTLDGLGLVESSEEHYNELKPGKGAEPFLGQGLPERVIVQALADADKPLHIKEVCDVTGLEQKHVGKNIKVLQSKGLAERQGPDLVLTDDGRDFLKEESPAEKVFALLADQGSLVDEEAAKKYDFFQEGFEELQTRSQLVVVKQRSRKKAQLSAEGRKTVAAGIAELEVATQLNPELLRDEKWRDVQFKSYDVQDEPAPLFPGKINPYQLILNQTRKIYLEMGFTEVASPHVESAFWGFDALFQPQDHPARDMQDTFYLRQPGKEELPEKELVDRVRATHENGGTTGSLGWGYQWNPDTAKQMVLRTHTTAASIRQLHETPEPPLKTFCIGRVFRRETVDYKHLPVFTQVDGIVAAPDASLAHLIGILREFYRKMGFDQIEVRPAFFPYTEPSLEVFVYLEEKKDWVEMGGAGIFRKEVTEPVGCDVPVLAWGLGLERLAMFRYGLTDIRDIYMANINWLREEPLCRL